MRTYFLNTWYVQRTGVEYTINKGSKGITIDDAVSPSLDKELKEILLF